jgi:DNA ligase-1
MKRFTGLFTELDATTKSSAKQSALASYFREADARDAAWAVAILTGRRLKRVVAYKDLRTLAAEESGLPEWLVRESHGAVGDLSETIALILPKPDPQRMKVPLSLAEVFEQRIRPMQKLDERGKARMLRETWAQLEPGERFVFHKLLSGSFRVGVQKRSVVRAIAEAFDLDPAVVSHRMSGRFEPTPEAFHALIAPEDSAAGADAARPYPFYLASPLETLLGSGASSTDEVPVEVIERELGPAWGWVAEWKWDGIRAQLIRRNRLADESPHRAMLWSRGEEEIAESFPEILAAAGELPDGTVLDGELVAYENSRPLPFQELQRRLQRKQRDALLFKDVPVVFIAYDLLEHRAEDAREQPLAQRRQLLESIVNTIGTPLIRISTPLEHCTWDDLAALRSSSRDRGVEGLMLKRTDSSYRVGRVRGDWWKWKVEPYTLDTVMVGAQLGHGRRASLFTDYTFAVWDRDPTDPNAELVPIAKAYSGLTNQQIKSVDKFVRDHTIARHGPTRTVEPEMVFELAFEGIQESPRHKSGIALRFPRIARIRHDKLPDQADTIVTARQLLASHRNPTRPAR